MTGGCLDIVAEFVVDKGQIIRFFWIIWKRRLEAEIKMGPTWKNLIFVFFQGGLINVGRIRPCRLVTRIEFIQVSEQIHILESFGGFIQWQGEGSCPGSRIVERETFPNVFQLVDNVEARRDGAIYTLDGRKEERIT